MTTTPGMSTERHVIGGYTHGQHEGRWARWGGLAGAFFFIPGIGHVALGDYARKLLRGTTADSVETHASEPEPVA